MDGVVGLTQCAIQSKTRFTYRFRIPDHQAGTFWYVGTFEFVCLALYNNTQNPGTMLTRVFNEQMVCTEDLLSISRSSEVKKRI